MQARLAKCARGVVRVFWSLRDQGARVGVWTRTVRAEIAAAQRPSGIAGRLAWDALFTSRVDLARKVAALSLQLESAQRQGRLHRCQPSRAERVLLAGLLRGLSDWRSVCFLVRPQTVLKWHAKGVALLWSYGRPPRKRAPRIAREVILLIQHMGLHCPNWGATRLQGQLAQLGVRVGKPTVQRYLALAGPRWPGPSWGVFWRSSVRPYLTRLRIAWRVLRTPRRQDEQEGHGQQEPEPEPSTTDTEAEAQVDSTWADFVREHLDETWACDFFTVTTVDFQALYVFFVIELGARRVRHWNVTRNPDGPWLVQQAREATAWGEGPRFLIRDRDSKFTARFDALFASCGARVLRTPPRRPVANSYAERFVRIARDELLHHVLVADEADLRHKLAELKLHYHARPHQGLGQRSPNEVAGVDDPRGGVSPTSAEVVAGPFRYEPVLDGLHGRYARVPLAA